MAPLLSAWANGSVHAVTLSSATGLANLLVMLGESGSERLRETPLFAAHGRVAEAARRRGIRTVVLAGTSDEEMLERLVAYFSTDD
jgi:uroporphyrinogen-III synthase